MVLLCQVRNLPVVWEGKVLGIVNVNDISDFSFSMEELGGKKAYMQNISERKGLPKVATVCFLFFSLKRIFPPSIFSTSSAYEFFMFAT